MALHKRGRPHADLRPKHLAAAIRRLIIIFIIIFLKVLLLRTTQLLQVINYLLLGRVSQLYLPFQVGSAFF